MKIENNMQTQIVICILFIILALIIFSWIVTGHYIRPLAIIVVIIISLLLISDKVKLIQLWLITSPLINWIYSKHMGGDALNAITIREFFDFDRIIIFIVFLSVIIGKDNYGRIKPKNVGLTYFAMLLFSLIILFNSFLLSYNKMNALRVSIDSIIIPFMCFYISKEIFVNRENFHRLIFASFIISIYLIALGLTEIVVTGNILRRIRWPFLYWETYGFILCFLFFIIMFNYLCSLERRKSNFILQYHVLILIFIILGIFFTLTRAVWLTFITGVLFFFNRTRNLIINPFRRFFFILIFGLITIFSFLLIFSPESLTKSEIYQSRISQSGTLDNRFETFGFALSQVKKYPLFGLGFRNFRDFFDRIDLNIEEFEYSNPGRSTLHNYYIGILTELGIFGFVSFILLIIGLILRVSTFTKSNVKIVQVWGYIGLSTIIMFIVSGIAYDPLFDYPYFFNKLFFLFMGSFFCNNIDFLEEYEL